MIRADDLDMFRKKIRCSLATPARRGGISLYGDRHVQSLLLTGIVVCVLMFGCTSNRPADSIASRTEKPPVSKYDHLVLNYETNNISSLLSRIRPASLSQSLTSRFHESSTADTADLDDQPVCGQWSQARIQIVYPHPNGDTNKGLARLIVTRDSAQTVSTNSEKADLPPKIMTLFARGDGDSEAESENVVSAASASSPVDEEVWQLDLAKEELDILLAELTKRGFFEKQERPRGKAVVTIKLDQGALSKRWTSEPRLEGLMLQVYNEGELAAFNTCNNRPLPASLTIGKSAFEG